MNMFVSIRVMPLVSEISAANINSFRLALNGDSICYFQFQLARLPPRLSAAVDRNPLLNAR